jgi:hypothetical protein
MMASGPTSLIPQLIIGMEAFRLLAMQVGHLQLEQLIMRQIPWKVSVDLDQLMMED